MKRLRELVNYMTTEKHTTHAQAFDLFMWAAKASVEYDDFRTILGQLTIKQPPGGWIEE